MISQTVLLQSPGEHRRPRAAANLIHKDYADSWLAPVCEREVLL